jgi:NAD(P)-dependent dehydrogenase (short-subunit alcohol dehydrogenase family)
MKAQAPGRQGIRGVVLNMASTAGVSPRPRLGWYNASKGWVITATRANAVELAPFGIRVVALNPVAGETPLLKTFMGEDTPEMRARFLSTIPHRALFHARRPGQCGLLPVQRRGQHDHRRVHGSRRRALHLRACEVLNTTSPGGSGHQASK